MSDLLKRGPGKLRISKSIAIAPYVRIRWGLTTGGALVLGGKGVTYSIPLWKPKTEAEKRAAAAKAEKVKVAAEAARKTKPRAVEAEPRAQADGDLHEMRVRVESSATFDTSADGTELRQVAVRDRVGKVHNCVVPAATLLTDTDGNIWVHARGLPTIIPRVVRVEMPCPDETVRIFMLEQDTTLSTQT